MRRLDRCFAVSQSPRAKMGTSRLENVTRDRIALMMAISSVVGFGYLSAMKLGIITAFHGRHDLTAMWAEHTAQFRLSVYVSITVDDVPNILTAEKHGFRFATMPNNPVGAKFQSALDMALADGCERIMVLPSDDFVSSEWVNRALTFDATYIIPARIAIHSPKDGTYALETNGRSCTRYGAGRVISREVVTRVGALWPGGRNKSLDSESHGRITAGGFTCVAVKTKQIPLVDVKTGENIWPWRAWRGGGHKCSADQALQMLSYEHRLKIARMS